MWEELDIELKTHETLRNALGPMFREIYLAQEYRIRRKQWEPWGRR